MKRAPFVTDRKSKTVCILCQVPRELHDKLQAEAEKVDMSKSEYVRELIIEHLRG